MNKEIKPIEYLKAGVVIFGSAIVICFLPMANWLKPLTWLAFCWWVDKYDKGEI